MCWSELSLLAIATAARLSCSPLLFLSRRSTAHALQPDSVSRGTGQMLLCWASRLRCSRHKTPTHHTAVMPVQKLRRAAAAAPPNSGAHKATHNCQRHQTSIPHTHTQPHTAHTPPHTHTTPAAAASHRPAAGRGRQAGKGQAKEASQTAQLAAYLPPRLLEDSTASCAAPSSSPSPSPAAPAAPAPAAPALGSSAAAEPAARPTSSSSA